MMHSTLCARAAALGGGVLALILLLTACGDSSTTSLPVAGHDGESMASSTSSPSGTPASGRHNAADVAFATGMIPHHGQAVAMAELAQTRAKGAAVKQLAAAIKAAQGPEIAQMSGWLAGWGAPVPDPASMATGMDHGSASMDDSAGGMSGMMSAGDMSALEDASGAAFDRMWLTGMVAHHQGAVAMAKAEVMKGANLDAKELARAIIAAQRAEITAMSELLAG